MQWSGIWILSVLSKFPKLGIIEIYIVTSKVKHCEDISRQRFTDIIHKSFVRMKRASLRWSDLFLGLYKAISHLNAHCISQAHHQQHHQQQRHCHHCQYSNNDHRKISTTHIIPIVTMILIIIFFL